MMVAKSF